MPRVLNANGSFVRQMLCEFEELKEGQRSILNDGILVQDVVSALVKKNCSWWQSQETRGMFGSTLTAEFTVLRCTERRPRSVVKSAAVLRSEFFEGKPEYYKARNLQITGNPIVPRLMKILAKAEIFVRHADGRMYRGGALMKALLDTYEP